MRSWLNGLGHRYVGIDISKVRVYEWLQKFGGPDLLADAHFLPFQDGKFDVVYSIAVTEHLACPFLVAQEVFRVLKPGGFYLGNCSFLEPWHDNSFFHMTPLGVYELLVQAGFKPLFIWPERNYSGYQAMMAMGNRFAQSFKLFGNFVYQGYRLSNLVRNRLNRLRGREIPADELDTARVAGAIFWIATRG
jgi:ubiquinone/menaquinone biosynthesis C-methylase UbiE